MGTNADIFRAVDAIHKREDAEAEASRTRLQRMIDRLKEAAKASERNS